VTVVIDILGKAIRVDLFNLRNVFQHRPKLNEEAKDE
jgi:hypothetical protein